MKTVTGRMPLPEDPAGEVKQFEEQFHCCVAFHDFSGDLSFLFGPDQVSLHHDNVFCEAVRSRSSASYHDCVHCDVDDLRELVFRGKPFIKRCHAGRYEAVYPLFKFQAPAGVMFAGIFRDEREMTPGMLLCGKLLADRIRTCLEYVPEAAGSTSYGNRIRIWMVHHFRDPDVSLSDLAEHLHLSRSRVSQLLRHELQKSFPALLLQYRLECAAGILTHSELPAQDCARLCGFRSANYLYRCFLRAYGQTPGQYRQENFKIRRNRA